MSDNKNWGRKSNDLRPPRDMGFSGRPADGDLAEALLKMIALGVAGGIALISGAKKLGEEIQAAQEEKYRKLEEQREKYKKAVRAAVANEIESEYQSASELDDPTDKLLLSPSPLEEQPESVDLILEASERKPLDEIRFDGQEDAEKRIESAMADYDAAMDEAAE